MTPGRQRPAYRSRVAGALALSLSLSAAAGCGSGDVLGNLGGPDASASPLDAGLAPPADASGGSADSGAADASAPLADAASAPDAAPLLPDDAVIVSISIPSTAAFGSQHDAVVVVRNTGSSNWTKAGGYTLHATGTNTVKWEAGTTGGTFGIAPADQAINLAAGDSVPTGAEITFAFKVRFYTCESSVLFSARMSRSATAFGGTAEGTVTVTPAASASCAGDPSNPATAVTWLDGTDVRQYAVNARLDSVAVTADHRKVSWTGARLTGGQWYAEKNFNHAACDPPVAGCVDGNMSVIGCINGRWYASTFDYVYAGVASATSRLEWEAAQTPFIQGKGAIATWCPKRGDPLYFVQHSLTRGGARPEPTGTSQVFGPVTWP